MVVARKTIEEVLKEYSNVLMAQHYVNEEYLDGKPYINVFVTKLTVVAEEKIPKWLEGYNVEVEEIDKICPLMRVDDSAH